MAEKKVIKKKLNNYLFLHKLFAGAAILMFVIVIFAGLKAGLQVSTIVYRSAVALVGMGIFARVVLSVLITYEEMNSGES